MKKLKLFHVYGEYKEIQEFLLMQGYSELEKAKTDNFLCISIFIGNHYKNFWVSDVNLVTHEIITALEHNVDPRAIDFSELVEILENLKAGELLKQFYKKSNLLPYATRHVFLNRVMEYPGEMKILHDRNITIDVSRN